MAILAVSMRVYTLQSKLLLFTRLKQQFHLLKTGVCNPYVLLKLHTSSQPQYNALNQKFSYFQRRELYNNSRSISKKCLGIASIFCLRVQHNVTDCNYHEISLIL